jgi:hypothetical protein
VTGPAPEGTITHTVTVQGQLEPAAGLYPLPPHKFYSAQRLTAAALATALGTTRADVYLVIRTSLSQPVYRERWVLAVELSGPSLTPATSDGHLSGLSAGLRVYPSGTDEAAHQLARDPNDTRHPRYAGQLCGLVAAQWLRYKLGTAPVALTVGGFGALTFTPQEMIYGAMYAPDPWTTVDYDDPAPAAYAFEATPQQDYQPGVWLVMADEPEGTAQAWKMSYCTPEGTSGVDNRWDDPAEPCPQFAPLLAP